MQNGAAETSDEKAETLAIDMYTREIEEIADMLDALKEELEQKEQLLIKVEETLEDTEQVLEKKIASIVDKDEKLKKIEEILKRKEEDMRIQEEELQTNAALEYLSFRAREDEISVKTAEVSEKEKHIDMAISLEELDEEIKKREEFLREIEERIKETGSASGGEGGIIDPKLVEELERREAEVQSKSDDLQEMTERLMQMEYGLREREQELFERAKQIQDERAGAGAGGAGAAVDAAGAVAADGAEATPVDQNLLNELEIKESEIQRLKDLFKKTEKNTESFKKQLEDMEIQLKEREEEVKYRENELENERKKLMEQMGMDGTELATMMANEQEVKYQIEREIKSKEKELSEKIQRKADLRIQPLLKKIELLTQRNEELETLEGDLERRQAEIEMRELQMRERFEEISYNEERLSKREERILHERMEIEQDRKKGKAAGGSDMELMEEEIRLKNEELRQMEERLAEREAFLRDKELEMKRMESKIIETDLELESAVEKEKKITKIKTGVRRLDDLLYGGLPLSANVFVYGPPFTGKLVLLNLFISEGLRRGIPAVFVLTDKSPSEIRDGLIQVLPKVEVYEKKGLLKYIDAYSKGMGIDVEEPNTIYVDKATDLDEIGMAVSKVQEGLKKKHKYHKIAFHSVSTVMAYTDAMVTFRFLQTLTSRNKRAGAVSLYCMDYGMFSDSEVQTLKHLMNGIIEFKVDDLKSFMRVEGICDVRTRGWIEYSHTTKDLLLKGSFAVDHIR